MTDPVKEVVKRYKLIRNDPEYLDQMCVRPDGNYVRYNDYTALRAELERVQARVAEFEAAARTDFGLREPYPSENQKK